MAKPQIIPRVFPEGSGKSYRVILEAKAKDAAIARAKQRWDKHSLKMPPWHVGEPFDEDRAWKSILRRRKEAAERRKKK